MFTISKSHPSLTAALLATVATLALAASPADAMGFGRGGGHGGGFSRPAMGGGISRPAMSRMPMGGGQMRAVNPTRTAPRITSIRPNMGHAAPTARARTADSHLRSGKEAVNHKIGRPANAQRDHHPTAAADRERARRMNGVEKEGRTVTHTDRNERPIELRKKHHPTTDFTVDGPRTLAPGMLDSYFDPNSGRTVQVWRDQEPPAGLLKLHRRQEEKPPVIVLDGDPIIPVQDQETTDRPPTPPTKDKRTPSGDYCTVVKPGNVFKKPADVDCGGRKGRIVVRTGDIIQLKKDANPSNKPRITISYEGAECLDCNWLQFVWREIQVGTIQQDGKLKYTALDGKVSRPPDKNKDGSEFKYDLTTDKNKPKWIVDTFHDQDNPYYRWETGCAEELTCKSDTMFDAPLVGSDQVNEILQRADFQKQMTDKVDVVYIGFHAEAYLVCNHKICAKVSWKQSWVWKVAQNQLLAGKPEPQEIKTTTQAGAAPDPDPDQKAALKREFGKEGYEKAFGPEPAEKSTGTAGTVSDPPAGVSSPTTPGK